MDRAQLSSQSMGNPDGPPLLLLHGFLSCAAQWDLNRERLSERFRLVIVELLGHGDSDAPEDADRYGPDHVLAELERIRIDHGVDRWWVCGQSLGGAIAMRYARTHPERTSGLIFTNSRAAFGIARPAAAMRQVIPDAPESTREIGVHPIHATRIPADIKAKLVAAADATPLHVVANTTGHRNEWRSIDHLHELTMPTLLVNGRWEKAFQRTLDEVRPLIDHIEIVDLEGGHAINIEQSEAFDRAVIEFVTQNDDGARPSPF